MPQHPNHFAIVVGIDAYAELEQLSGAGADADATRFAEWLTSPQGGGVPVSNAQVFVGDAHSIEKGRRARPQRAEIERALRNLGVESGARVGERLYFFFAGMARRGANGELGVLFADAAPDTSEAILDVRDVSEFVRGTRAFDELVIVIDYGVVPGVPRLAQPLRLRRAEIGSSPDEVKIVQITQERLPGQPGLLTGFLIEGLGGAAADLAGDVRAIALAHYVERRMHEVAPHPALQRPRVEVTRDIVLTPPASSLGTLVVEVPHWATEVRVYDSLLRPIPNVGPVAAESSGKRVYCSITRLPPGIYAVDASLEGRSQRRLATLTAGGARIAAEDWNELDVPSTAPVRAGRGSSGREAELARAWSLAPTAGALGGDSRLFLFVRSVGPDDRPHAWYPKDLTLLDASQKALTDFSGDIATEPQATCFAFNSDLPSGYYILRRGGERLRHQGIYLCSGWETHVFIVVDKRSSLRRMTVGMAPRGAGFRADDEWLDAAEVVLDGLSRGTKRVVNSSQVSELLERKLENPWFGVLAGYALLTLAKDAPDEATREDASRRLGQLLPKLQEISSHPDVRALQIDRQTPCDGFPYPPLLRAGLERVRRQAARYSGTVAVGSLTDRVLDVAVGNSPWTAWRQLEVSRDGAFEHLGADEEPASLPKRVVRAATAALGKALSPRRDNDRVTLQQTLARQALVTEARYLLRRTPIKRLPESIKVKTKSIIEAALHRDPTPDAAALSGLSLARIRKELSEAASTFAHAAQHAADDRDALLAPIQQVVQHAMRKFVREQPTAELPHDDGAAADEAGIADSDRLSDVVFKLKGECTRLTAAIEKASNDESSERVRKLAGVLQGLSETILKRAQFIAMTDRGKIVYSNAAFRALLIPPGEAKIASEVIALHEAAWCAALSDDHTPLSDPIALRDWKWNVTRTVIRDADAPDVHVRLNVLTVEGAAPLAEDQLGQLEANLATVTLYSTLLAHGSGDDRTEYFHQLAGIAEKLEASVNAHLAERAGA